MMRNDVLDMCILARCLNCVTLRMYIMTHLHLLHWIACHWLHVLTHLFDVLTHLCTFELDELVTGRNDAGLVSCQNLVRVHGLQSVP